MAKASSESAAGADAPAADGGGAGGESIMGYFRAIFKAKPKLLKVRSNEELFRQWLADHPGETVVPDKVKNGLANLKSLLRKGKGKKAGKGTHKAAAAATPAAPANGATALHIPASKLEALEQQIDDCLALAKSLDREALENVIRSLRRARNEIIQRLAH
jgi:hypothetical protein